MLFGVLVIKEEVSVASSRRCIGLIFCTFPSLTSAFGHRLVYYIAGFHAADGGVAAVNPQSADEVLLPFPLHLDDDVVLVQCLAVDVQTDLLLPRKETVSSRADLPYVFLSFSSYFCSFEFYSGIEGFVTY